MVSWMCGFHAGGKVVTVRAGNLPYSSHEARRTSRKGPNSRHRLLRHAAMTHLLHLSPTFLSQFYCLPRVYSYLFSCVYMCIYVCEYICAYMYVSDCACTWRVFMEVRSLDVSWLFQRFFVLFWARFLIKSGLAIWARLSGHQAPQICCSHSLTPQG